MVPTMGFLSFKGQTFQLRMDFSTFTIAGPNTVTTSGFFNLAGSVSTTTGELIKKNEKLQKNYVQ